MSRLNSQPRSRLPRTRAVSSGGHLSWQGAAGFSLVEFVLAIGVVSFAFVGVVGLMPNGLKTCQRAIELNVEAQISQRIASQMQLSPYASLKSNLASTSFPQYFDDEGMALSGPQGSVYTVTLDSASPVNMTLPGSTTANGSILQLKFLITSKSTQKTFSVVIANNGL